MDENEIGHMHNLIYTYLSQTSNLSKNITQKSYKLGSLELIFVSKFKLQYWQCFFVKKFSCKNLSRVGRKKPFLIQWEQSYFTDAYILSWATNFSSTWEPLSQEGGITHVSRRIKAEQNVDQPASPSLQGALSVTCKVCPSTGHNSVGIWGMAWYGWHMRGIRRLSVRYNSPLLLPNLTSRVGGNATFTSSLHTSTLRKRRRL